MYNSIAILPKEKKKKGGKLSRDNTRLLLYEVANINNINTMTGQQPPRGSAVRIRKNT